MIYVAVIASLCTIVFLIRLIQERKQLVEITSQLKDYNKQATEMKVNMTLSNRHVEALAVEINQIIAGLAEQKANTHQVERELKQAIAGVSHDLRTPLTSIIGYMQLIADQGLDEAKKSEYLEIAQKRALRLQKLLNDFFALSIVESEDYPIELEATNVNALVKETLLSYYDQFQAMNLHPTVKITDEELIGLIDENACKRVLENLLSNTLQHSAGDIRISLDRQDTEAVLIIKNKLNHADQIQMDKLFERFYTTDQTRQSSKGLGLTIVQSLMNRMNGEVIVKVENGEFSIICKWISVE
jgi:signal transduction histidine kinase